MQRSAWGCKGAKQVQWGAVPEHGCAVGWWWGCRRGAGGRQLRAGGRTPTPDRGVQRRAPATRVEPG